MKTFFYVLTFLGGIIGTILLFSSFVVDSAPQQGALAAMAVAFVVIPYCMARAIELGGQRPLSEEIGKAFVAQAQIARQMQQPAPPPSTPPQPATAQPRQNPFAPRAS